MGGSTKICVYSSTFWSAYLSHPPRHSRYVLKKMVLALRVLSSQPGEGDLTFYHACKDSHYDLFSLKNEMRRKV